MASESGDDIRVLHVDDDADFVSLSQELLEREDQSFHVETATSVSDGLDRISDGEIDCIVSDYDMPQRNGLDFLEAVRETSSRVPFILFTGKGSEEIASQAITAGVDDYLQKSIGRDQYTLLAKRISNAVAKRRSEAEAARTRRFFSTLIEHATDVIPVIGPDGTITYMSPSSEWLLGYEPAELVGENAFEYVHPDDVEHATTKFAERIEHPESMPEIEFRFEHADGSWVRLHGRARNLLDNPVVEGVVAYNRLVEE